MHKLIITGKSITIHVFMTIRVFQTIPQFTARQPAKLPKRQTQNSSFPCTVAFSAQLHSQPQPATASPNKEALKRPPRRQSAPPPP